MNAMPSLFYDIKCITTASAIKIENAHPNNLLGIEHSRIMAAFTPFKLSPQEPESSSYAQLKIWIDELSSYEHELMMEIASLSQMVRKQYTTTASAMVRHYKALLSDIRQIREMFEEQKYDIKFNSLSKRLAKRIAR